MLAKPDFSAACYTNEAFLFAIAGLCYADLSLKFINGSEKPHSEIGDFSEKPLPRCTPSDFLGYS